MYFVYADGVSIYNPFDSTLTIHSPKVTLELGKAGSFQFDIPPTNQFYNQLTELKTVIRVELDNKTIFYGRVFSISRNFNNIKKVYCEGALSYLVDTLQQAESYKGKAAPLFRKIIEAHNKLADSDKKFTVNKVQIQDQDVIIPGKKDKDGNYYGDKYEQTIIESIAEEWLTTYDYINNVLIEYLGGYLMCDYDFPNDKLKISYISEDQFDSMISEAESRNLTVPSIDYGVNMLDLTEELNAEDLCTVLIPLGDDGLTIEKATNKDSHSDVKVVKIDDKYIGIAHKASVEKYGTIIKSYVFDNVNEANTLFTNGYKYLKAHKNIPLSFTVKAVDMHFVNPDQDTITLGEIAKIDSTPHELTQYLICTKIEYDFEDASKNLYTFGNPRQSMTERYKKNKEKARSRASRSSAKSSGKALSTASEITQEYVDNAVQEINDNYATTKTWVDKHYAGIEDAVHFVSSNGEGFVRATSWVDRYGANAEEVLTWHGRYADSAVSTIKWANDNSAGIEETVSWKNANAEGLVNTKRWVDSYSAGILESVEWKSQNADGLISTKKWVDDNSAGITDTMQWKNKNAQGLIDTKKWIDSNSAGISETVKWKNDNATGLANTKKWVDSYSAGIEDTVAWKKQNASGLVNTKKWVDSNSAGILSTVQWKNKNADGLVSTKNWVDSNSAGISSTVKWKNDNASGLIASKQWVDKYSASLLETVKWKTANANGLINAKKWIDDNSAGISQTVAWKNNYASGLINTQNWINNNSAGITETIQWRKNNASGLIESKNWIDEHKAGITQTIDWKNNNASGLIETSKWVTEHYATVQETIDWKNNYASGIITTNKWVSEHYATVQDTIDWKNNYASGIITTNKWVSDHYAGVESTVNWKNKNGEGVVLAKNWVENNKSAIEQIVTWKSSDGKNLIETAAGAKAIATNADALASFFATYNGATASIELTANATGTMAKIAAEKIDASASDIIAKALTAENIETKVFKANGFTIGSDTISITRSIWQTINDGDVTVIRNLYTGSSADANTRVLSRYGTQNLINSTISSLSFVDKNLNLDSTAVRKAIKGEHSSVLKWLIDDLLYRQKLKIDEGTQIFDSNGTGVTLKQYITNLIDADYIKKALTGADIAKKLANQTINCNVLTVKKDDKSQNILDLVKDAKQNHYHTINKGAVVVAVATDGKIKNTADVSTGYGKAY